MYKLTYLVVITATLWIGITGVKSSVTSLQYEIVFAVPSTDILREKQRIQEVYNELVKGVQADYLYETILLGKDEFLSDSITFVEMKGDTLVLYVQKEGKMRIKGTFEDICKVSVEQESWFIEKFRK